MSIISDEAIKGLEPILKPKSVAIIGASQRVGSIGRVVLHNIMESDFNGAVYPVNPKASFIHSMKAYKSVSDIPDPVDLAVVIVPRDYVIPVVDECGTCGIKGVIVISAGFKEIGEDGAKREDELLETVQRHGMRMVGPNCLGIVNMDPDIRFNATFAPVHPWTGNLAFLSQSGALGVSIMQQMEWLGIGFSYFVSIGNNADVKSDDLLAYWEDDDATKVIALYMESFGDPQVFFQIAKRTSKKKPIIVVKSGRTEAGMRAASSHTGALSGADVTTDAFLRQCGAIRTGTIEELLGLLMAFCRSPLPKGNRMAVLTNSGGPGIMVTDAIISRGLKMAQFSDETTQKLIDMLPLEASKANPIDLTAWGKADAYRTILPILLEDPNVDMIISLFVPPMMVDPADVARAIAEARRGFDKPVLGVVMAEESSYRNLPKEIPDCPPIYPFPEMAVKAAAVMYEYTKWQARPEGTVKKFEFKTEEAKRILEQYKKEGGYIPTVDCLKVLNCYGFPTVPTIETEGPDEALTAAHQLDYPVTFKVAGHKFVHKSDMGGVVLNIKNDLEMEGAYAQIRRTIVKAGENPDEEAGLVQKMANPGREVILGMSVDPKMGPVIMFGLGGKYVEVMKDVTTRIPPLSDEDAFEMIRSIRGYPLLKGVRGDAGIHFETLQDCLMRFSQMVLELDEIIELDINPFILGPHVKDCTIVDARMRVGKR
jgi:acetate---CoA ligase (ADP-forming)